MRVDYEIATDRGMANLIRKGSAVAHPKNGFSVHVLDTRQYRSDQPAGDGFDSTDPDSIPLEPVLEEQLFDADGILDPSASLLGDGQEAWLARNLRRSRATWNLLAQQVMVTEWNLVEAGRLTIELDPSIPDPVKSQILQQMDQVENMYNVDAWDGYQADRRRLLDLVARSGASNPIVLTGDIHSAWGANLVQDFADPDSQMGAAEFVCSSISSTCGGLDPRPTHFVARQSVLADNPHASLNRDTSGALIQSLATLDDPQARVVAEIIQRTHPDVLLVNEFDFDTEGPNGGSLAARLFQDNYLGVSQNGADPIFYPYRRAFPSNTGIHSSVLVPGGLDLNKDGVIDPVPDHPFPGFIAYGDDSLGFGAVPGQFAFVVYSMYPIDEGGIRTFQNFLWNDMPGALLPIDPETGESFYTEEDLAILSLSSKNYADVPIRVGRKVVHFLVSHPTPPVFDGPEDRNGTRNHDEIRFWTDYVLPSRSGYIVDDAGVEGGVAPGALFVIAGDQNSDLFDGDSIFGSAQQLLDHPLINTRVTPVSQGGVDRSIAQDEINDKHLGNPAFTRQISPKPSSADPATCGWTTCCRERI